MVERRIAGVQDFTLSGNGLDLVSKALHDQFEGGSFTAQNSRRVITEPQLVLLPTLD